ncbi:MAG: LemA family protein [Marinifilaceae bacterium]
MKQFLIVLGVLGALLIGTYVWFKGSYNQMVRLSEAVSSQWSNVENQYQRRLDLIPNLVNTVKGYAAHEEGTFTAVTNARAKATQTQVSFNELTDQTMQRLNQAQGELSSALSKLLAVKEAYPDLKANTNFLDLQAQLEGTENRIAVERRKYNDITREYNSYIRSFPKNIIANMFNFPPKPYFEANAGAQNAPQVQF